MCVCEVECVHTRGGHNGERLCKGQWECKERVRARGRHWVCKEGCLRLSECAKGCVWVCKWGPCVCKGRCVQRRASVCERGQRLCTCVHTRERV